MFRDIKELKGKTIKSITVDKDRNEILFYLSSTERVTMYHEQDCCEHVNIEDVCGDLDDLIGNPLITTEERCEDGSDEDGYDSLTWTFYELATIKGSLTIRWYGISNGYYSESVDIIKEVYSEECGWSGEWD